MLFLPAQYSLPCPVGGEESQRQAASLSINYYFFYYFFCGALALPCLASGHPSLASPFLRSASTPCYKHSLLVPSRPSLLGMHPALARQSLPLGRGGIGRAQGCIHPLRSSPSL